MMGVCSPVAEYFVENFVGIGPAGLVLHVAAAGEQVTELRSRREPPRLQVAALDDVPGRAILHRCLLGLGEEGVRRGKDALARLVRGAAQ